MASDNSDSLLSLEETLERFSHLVSTIKIPSMTRKKKTSLLTWEEREKKKDEILSEGIELALQRYKEGYILHTEKHELKEFCAEIFLKALTKFVRIYTPFVSSNMKISSNVYENAAYAYGVQVRPYISFDTGRKKAGILKNLYDFLKPKCKIHQGKKGTKLFISNLDDLENFLFFFEDQLTDKKDHITLLTAMIKMKREMRSRGSSGKRVKTIKLLDLAMELKKLNPHSQKGRSRTIEELEQIKTKVSTKIHIRKPRFKKKEKKGLLHFIKRQWV